MPGIWLRVRGSFALKVALTIVLVVLGDWLFWQQGRSAGTFGLYGLLIVITLWLAHPAIGRRRSALIALVLAATYALAMAYAPSLLAWLLFWVAATLAALLPRTAGFDDGWRWFQRLVGHAAVAFVGPLLDWTQTRGIRRRRRMGRTRPVLPVILLPLLGSLVFVWLFAAANPVIESWLASFNFPGIDGMLVLRCSIWIILAWAAWAVLRPRLTAPVFGTFDGSGEFAIPGVSAASVMLSLVAFNALFLLQNTMDAAWLWGLAALPGDMTLADYAHRGAYPLVATALFAALFVLVALRPGSATAHMPLVRHLVAGWIGQNLFLVFNAALRTVDYVEAYSLTVLRIAALLWMALVAAGLVLVLWRMLAGRSSTWLINTNLAAAGVLLTGVCFVDLGAIAAQWNVRHAREVDGTGARLDLCYLHELGDSALLPLIELENRDLPHPLHAQVANVRRSIQGGIETRLDQGGWSWLAARRLETARGRAGDEVGVVEMAYGMRCDGRPYPPPPPSPVSLPSADPSPAAVPPSALTPAPER